MTRSEILDVLDYVKTLAEEGKNAPILGGRIGLWWGILLCITLFVQWIAVKGIGPLAIEQIGFAWLAFGIIGTVGSMVLGRSLAKKPGTSSMNNRVAAALWTGNAILLFTYGFSAGLSAGFGHIGFEIMDTIMPVAFGLYALTAYVLAKISDEKWQLIPGAIAWAFVPICLFLQGTSTLFLAAIVGVIFTIIIPDIIHLRREPKTVV